MLNTAVRRTYPQKPVRIAVQLIHEVRVAAMDEAREFMRFCYQNFKNRIDQETLVDFTTDGNTTNVAFVIGTREIHFSYKEGAAS